MGAYSCPAQVRSSAVVLSLALAACAVPQSMELRSVSAIHPPPKAVPVMAEGPTATTQSPSPPIQQPVERAERDDADENGGAPRPTRHLRRRANPAAPALLARAPSGAVAAARASAAPAGARAFCDVTNEFMDAEQCAEATTVAANARLALGSVEYPHNIYRGETSPVAFTIDASRDRALSTTPSAQGTGEQRFTLKVTGMMAARLTGEGFRIDPAEIQYHELGISQATRWDWNITALKAPRHTLTLTAYMVVMAPNGSRTSSAIVPSRAIDIPVQVTIEQRVSDAADDVVALSNGAKAILAALTALVVALAAFRTKVMALVGKRAAA